MLSFGSAPGNLFNRLGKIGLLVKQLKSYQTSQLANMTDTVNGVVAQYNSEPDIQAIMGDSYIGILSATDSIISTVAQQLAASTVNRMVFRDNPQFNQTLTSSNTVASLLEVIRQMDLAGATVLAQTVGSTVSAFTGTGNGVLVCSTVRPIDGKTLETAFAETLTVSCSADSYTGGATAGNESFSVTGAGQETDVFAFDWPLGSNGNIGIQAIDGNTSNGDGNILTNSGFETWTVTDTPDNFVIDVGTAGTQVFQETSIIYDGTSALKLLGDGTTLTRLYQQFNTSSSGTGGALSPLTQYSMNVFVRRDGIAAGSGTLIIELVDQNGAVINDQNGVANSTSIDLTALSVNYTAYNAIFRMPEIIPTSYFIRLRLSAVLTSGRSVYLDKLSLGAMTQVYTGGPFLSIHAGAVPFTSGDYTTCVITNGRGSGGTLSTFQTLLYQLFPDAQNNEIIFPSSATPTISDSLIG